MKRTGPGGRASGMAEVWVLMRCHNQRESSLSRLLSYRCGAQTSLPATSSSSFSHRLFSFRTLTEYTRRYSVSPGSIFSIFAGHSSCISVWLRPSKQIRAPLYSIKQKRQRRWIIVKYGIVYIIAFAIFAALIAVREYPPSVLPALFAVLTMFCATAVAFRERLTFSCSICQGI